MRRKNVKAKIKQKYGCGIGKDYKDMLNIVWRLIITYLMDIEAFQI